MSNIFIVLTFYDLQQNNVLSMILLKSIHQFQIQLYVWTIGKLKEKYWFARFYENSVIGII